jgi:chromosomal replication initiation ATPase DnaA
MSAAARQLPLVLPPATRWGIEDFVVGAPNAAAFAGLHNWASTPIGLSGLSGPPGAGKSHLATIAAASAGVPVRGIEALTTTDPLDLVRAGAVVVDAIDAAGPLTPAHETVLFHLINAARQHPARLLLVSNVPLAALPVVLPDLGSRLRAATPFALDEPDDALLLAVLEKLCGDHQLVVDTSVLAYCATRMERSYAAARRLVAALDADALAERRPVTRALARRTLTDLGVSRQLALPGLGEETDVDLGS